MTNKTPYMKTNFTAGPYRITTSEGVSHKPICICRKDGTGIAEILGRSINGDWDAETKANADLLRSAPDLAEALQGMLKWARRVRTLNPGPEILGAITALQKAGIK